MPAKFPQGTPPPPPRHVQTCLGRRPFRTAQRRTTLLLPVSLAARLDRAAADRGLASRADAIRTARVA